MVKNNMSGKGASPKKDASILLAEKINRRLIEPVKVRNLTPVVCVLHTGRRGEANSEKMFGGYQILSIQLQELINVATNTKLFTGDDGKGTNAYLYIEDKEVRQYLGFDKLDSETGIIATQDVLNDETVLGILNNENKETFEETITSFCGDIAKIKLIEDVIKRTGYNNAQRIKYIESTLDINIKL